MEGIEQQPVHRRVTPAAILRWLAQGWVQFRGSWQPSLLFAAIFGAVGLAGAWLSLSLGMALAFYPFVSGFMLVAPVLVTGFYRAAAIRRDGGRPRFPDLLRAFRVAPPALWFIAFVSTLIFLVWVTDALVLYSFLFGTDPLGLLDYFGDVLRRHTLLYLGFGTLMGFVLAAAIFAVTAFSVPLAFHRGTHFVNAIVASVRAVFGNTPTMALWGAAIAGLMFLALTVAWPLFPVVLPVLAYASDAAYREVFGSDYRPG